MKTKKILIVITLFFFQAHYMLHAQPTLETGNGEMPDEWVDGSTGHLIKRLIPQPGDHRSFYFHNNPFTDGQMVYYGSNAVFLA